MTSVYLKILLILPDERQERQNDRDETVLPRPSQALRKTPSLPRMKIGSTTPATPTRLTHGLARHPQDVVQRIAVPVQVEHGSQPRRSSA